MPSAGTRSPGRTRTTSPTVSSASGTSTTVPSSVTLFAVSGSSAASASSALDAAPSARISSQCPSSMMVTSAASSHQKSRSNPPMDSVVAHEAPNATVMAMAMSSIIPG